MSDRLRPDAPTTPARCSVTFSGRGRGADQEPAGDVTAVTAGRLREVVTRG
ncbi:hypothetical protein [Streptomyces sp. NPDC052107]|uniref:hypothetical protein n=1 Tax=Streptomyces sp. NPDC052107 TaxID=3155632 RepID=UPI0034353234